MLTSKKYFKYSVKEEALFKYFKAEELTLWYFPEDVYKAIMTECFILNDSGPAVDSVRRCIKAFRDMEPLRMTPEWDNLIYLGDDDL